MLDSLSDKTIVCKAEHFEKQRSPIVETVSAIVTIFSDVQP